jgi:hypothetical protein
MKRFLPTLLLAAAFGASAQPPRFSLSIYQFDAPQ